MKRVEPTATLARRFWAAIEPIHAIVYFAPEPVEAGRRIGLRGFWMSYFAGRVAPMGAVPAEAVVAMAYGFAPAMVKRAIPDAWTFADPTTVVSARITSAGEALQHHLGTSAVTILTELSGLLWTAIEAARFDGRPLAAAWSQVPRPVDTVESAWLATTILREHRGDGHVLAGVGAGLRGLDATVSFVATGAISRELIQPSRGWSDEDWERSVGRLQARGLLDRYGRLTKTGGTLRREIEDLTDRLASAPVERLGETSVERAIALSTPLSHCLIDTGVIPVPNAIGAPRP